MYVYVCMYGCMDVWMYGCMDVWMYGCMYAWMYGCMDVWMYVCNMIIYVRNYMGLESPLGTRVKKSPQKLPQKVPL